MIASRTEVDYLVHCLACAINGKTPSCGEDIDYAAFFDLAKKHQVYNIIFPILKDMPQVPDQYKKEFRNYSLSEYTRMLTINNERENIYDELDAAGVKYMPLKGLVIRDYYPKQSMRQMSDNDILFDASCRDTVADIMRRNNYKSTATGENSDDYFKAPHCTFEFHRTLFFNEHDFCPVFDGLWERATRDEERPCMYHMGIDDVYIYSVCHMYKHFSTAGCGIRFLADHYLFLKKENDNLDWDYINAAFDRYGIADYEYKSRLLAFKLFDGQPLDDDDLPLFETYINFGIYGDGSILITKRIESIANGGSVKKAKFIYLMRRLFPPKKKMIADHRVLEKHPYLLPFMYVYRLFKGLFNSKKTISEIKNVNSVDK